MPIFHSFLALYYFFFLYFLTVGMIFTFPRFSIVKNLFESLPLESNTKPRNQPLTGRLINSKTVKCFFLCVCDCFCLFLSSEDPFVLLFQGQPYLTQTPSVFPDRVQLGRGDPLVGAVGQ